MSLAVAAKNKPRFLALTSSASIGASTLTTALSIPKHADGDFIMVCVHTTNAETASMPAGWPLLGSIAATNAGNTVKLWVFTRVTDGSEGSTVTVTKTGTVSTWWCTATSWINCSGVDTFASQGATVITDTVVTIPTITPTVTQSTVVAVACTRASNFAVPPTWTTYASFGTLATRFTYGRIRRKAPTATGTGTVALSTTQTWASMAIVLKS